LGAASHQDKCCGDYVLEQAFWAHLDGSRGRSAVNFKMADKGSAS
jgi:hypothetical protein